VKIERGTRQRVEHKGDEKDEGKNSTLIFISPFIASSRKPTETAAEKRVRAPEDVGACIHSRRDLTEGSFRLCHNGVGELIAKAPSRTRAANIGAITLSVFHGGEDRESGHRGCQSVEEEHLRLKEEERMKKRRKCKRGLTRFLGITLCDPLFL